MTDHTRPRLRSMPLLSAGLALAVGLSLRPALALDDLPPATEPMTTAGLPASTPASLLVRQIAPVDARVVSEAVSLYRKGRVADADAIAAGISDQTTRIALEWLAIRCNPGTIRFARINRFLDAQPDWPNQTALQRRAEEALSAERLPAAHVIAFFETRTPVTPVGRVAQASALAITGETARAGALIRTVWHRDPLTATTESAVLARFLSELTPEDHRIRARTFLLREQAAMALRAAARVDADFVRLAQAQLAAQRKAGAAPSLLASVPKTLHSDPVAIFTQAMLHRRADKAELAATTMLTLPAQAAIGDGDGWWTERRLIARKLLDAGKAELAYLIVAGHHAEGGAARVEAEFHAGWIALRFLKDGARALPHFARVEEAATTPHSQARALFWQGQALAALADAEAATAHLRHAGRHGATYHGQLARAELGETDYSQAQAAPRPPVMSLPARVVRLLRTAGADEMAFTLLQDMVTSRLDPTHIATLAGTMTLTATQRLTLGKLAHALNAPLEEIAYPTDGVPAMPANDEVETPILHAIARQESAFNPHAVSHVGARGLMQMMPATARETARRFALAYDPRRLTGDPAYSATLGSAHLVDLMRAWRGSYVLTFAAYNAGSGNVKDWIAAYGDPRDPQIDPVDWIERIPFSETRHYVQKIMENLQVYRARIAGVRQIGIADDLRRRTMVIAAVKSETAAGDNDPRLPHMP